MSGHILIKILSTFSLILGIFSYFSIHILLYFIFFLEIMISSLQAYVFLILVTIYITTGIYLH